ncbi:hypothetical protein BN12_790036 [Nostocoides japonicum T1-X7]|uniref:Uncharacterized protein n=1 Tax=Nostocoides japonicum T1-X7 TaxID=1194083 RepID=A0A077M564_9MICO|nr:hypothetical protein BN12_790036 [Tetrasphaera japonica T1-X7]
MAHVGGSTAQSWFRSGIHSHQGPHGFTYRATLRAHGHRRRMPHTLPGLTSCRCRGQSLGVSE